MALAGLGLISLGLLESGRNVVRAAEIPKALTQTCRTLEEIILKNARAKDNPWLLIHGIRAMGSSFSLEDGLAIEYLCSHYLQEKEINSDPIREKAVFSCF